MTVNSKGQSNLLTFFQPKVFPSIMSCSIVLSLFVLGSLVPAPSAQDILEVGFDLVEDQPAGTYVGNVLLAANLDKVYPPDVVRRIQFRLMRQHTAGFEVDSSTGVIRTNAVIDRESLCPGAPVCSIRLDIGIQPVEYFRLIRATVTVVDINDHDPVFSPLDRRTVELSESSAVGTVVTLPGATDPDGPGFSVRRYALRTNPPSENFALESDGRQVDGSPGLRLILVKNLDRESVADYRLLVTAYDGDDPPRSGTLELDVKVLDANDNSPVFDRDKYELTIPENLTLRTVILKVSATDSDSGDNARISYSFSPFTANAYGNVFGLDSTTGEIYVNGTIDHESSSVYRLVVVAQDSGPDPVPSSAAVVLTVEDLNDNSPEISYDSMSDLDAADAEVREDALSGTFVAHLTVTDRDSGENGRFNCTLVDDWHFQLRALTESEFQIYLASPVDRELKDAYNLTVECGDFGVPGRVSRQSILVQVTDVNDWEPTFTDRVYRTELIENNYVGAFVVQVSAADRDKGPNAEIRYTLISNVSGTLRIDPSSGIITSLVSFDRETLDGMTFVVVARDRGTPSLSSSATVVMTIADVNDNRPVFRSPFYSFSVNENEAPETEVGAVVASDADSGLNGEISYAIGPGPSSGAFRISNTGVIRTTAALDREETAVHYLKVTASDAGEPPLTATVGVTVTVADVNDNAPRFEFPSGPNDTVHVSIYATSGYEVARVRAVDSDSGQNARLTFALSNDSLLTEHRFFRVDNVTGSVTVDGDLTDLDGRHFDLKIVTCDAGADVIRCSAGVLHVYVNRSVLLMTSHRTDRSPLLDGPHLTIVVALATVCGVITTVLVVAVVMVRRKKVVKYEHHYNCRTAALRMFPSSQTKATRGGAGVGPGGTGNGGKCLAYSSSETGSTTLIHETVKRPRSPAEEGRRADELSSSTKKLLQTNQNNSQWSVNSRYRDTTIADPKVQPLLRSDSTKIHPPNGDEEDRNYFQLYHSGHEEAGRISRHGSPRPLPLGSDGGSRPSLRVSSQSKLDRNQAELEVNHLLEILKQENDVASDRSVEGSNADSGRGPSEEGERVSRHLNKKSNPENSGNCYSITGKKALAEEMNGPSSSSPPPPEKWSQPLATTPRTRTLCGSRSCLKGSPASHKSAQVHPGCVPNQYVASEPSSTPRYNAGPRPPPQISPDRGGEFSRGCDDKPDHKNRPTPFQTGGAPFRPNGGRPPGFDQLTGSFNKAGFCGGGQEMDGGRAWARRQPLSRGWDDDDDAATTTSGSYVVDPKELCEEIDELFFSDDRKAL